jgi:hypothetical protein
VEAGIAFESSDQKTRAFLLLVVLLWCFFEYTRKVFDEMCEKQ